MASHDIRELHFHNIDPCNLFDSCLLLGSDMSTVNFSCTEHTVLGQHIRHYLRSSSLSQEDEFHLHVKQYTPHSSLPPQEGDVTILACHASGFPKELYEPFWDDLLAYSKRTSSFRIRNIWIADVFNQGQSGVFNEHKLGNERSLSPYHSGVQSMSFNLF